MFRVVVWRLPGMMFCALIPETQSSVWPSVRFIFDFCLSFIFRATRENVLRWFRKENSDGAPALHDNDWRFARQSRVTNSNRVSNVKNKASYIAKVYDYTQYESCKQARRHVRQQWNGRTYTMKVADDKHVHRIFRWFFFLKCSIKQNRSPHTFAVNTNSSIITWNNNKASEYTSIN